MLVAPPGGEPVLLDFFVEAPGRGADRRRARRWSPSTSRSATPSRCSTSAPPSCGAYGMPAGVAAAARALRHACRWPSSPRPPPRSPATASRSTRQQALPVRDPRADHARHAGVARALRARRARRCARASRARPGARRRARAPRRRGRRRRSTRGDIARGGVATGCASAAARSRASDLAAYARDRRASRCASRYRGREVLTNPPPSAGGILIAYALALLERARRRRRTRRALVARDGGARRPSARRSSSTGLAEPGFLERFMASRLGSTTHISVLDADGWACAVTCTNGEGSGVVVPGTGIHLNNMMGEQDLSPLGFHAPAGAAAAVDDGADGRARRRRARSSCSARPAPTGSARRCCR